MKRHLVLFIAIALTYSAVAQTTQPCVVKQYNQKEVKTPLPGVEVMVSNAGTEVSDARGLLKLEFRTLKPGDKVNLISAKKDGFEVMNKESVDQWNISRNQTPFELVMVNSAYFSQLKRRLTQASTESYRTKYEQAFSELERLKKDGQLKEEEYNAKCDELESSYQAQLKNLDNYIDQFARIDLSEVSAEEQRILEMVEEGKIDEAVEAYEALGITDKLRKARENKRALEGAKARIEDEVASQTEAIEELKAKQSREIATLKLAGGKENYDKVGRMLKENALVDTTDVNAVFDYALFCHNQKVFAEAERFYLILLANYTNLYNSNPDAYRSYLAIIQSNLGVLYSNLHDYAKSEDYYLKALENRTQLFARKPDTYRSDLARTQSNLGVLYGHLHDYAKSEEYSLKALENWTQLFGQNPDAYRSDLALTQVNLGRLYSDLHDYAKSEGCLLKALENYTHLFNQNPDAYRSDLAATQINLGALYSDLHDYAKSEGYFLKALENYTQLFNQNPDAFRSDLAEIQINLGGLYSNLHDYAKSEEYSLKALENWTQLFNQNPDAYRSDLALTQINLGNLYIYLHDYAKSEGYFLKALEDYTQLFNQNPEAYRSDLAKIQINLGVLYSDLHDNAKSEEYYLKALENRMQLFAQKPDAYRSDLAKIQINLGNLYRSLHDNAKSEEYSLKALENWTQLFNQNPDAYRSDLASAQNNLGALYSDLHDYAKSEEYYLKALENWTQLSGQNPDAYRSYLALTQQNLGNLYICLHDYPKSEEYYLNALENYKILLCGLPFFRPNVSWIQYGLSVSWIQYMLTQLNAEDDEKYDAMLDPAFQNYEKFFKDDDDYQSLIEEVRKRKGWLGLVEGQNRDEYSVIINFKIDYRVLKALKAEAYDFAKDGNYTKALETIDEAIALMPEEAEFYDSKGEILLMVGDEQSALTMWKKVQELDPEFLSKNNGHTNLYDGLMEKGLINE